MTATDVKRKLAVYANPRDAVFLQRFFKTGAGQYGEGDVFIGVRVPDTRKVCKEFRNLGLGEIQKLLDSEVHEHRLAAVILLADGYAEANEEERQRIFDLYLKNVHAGRVNNWDLVDVSAEFIVGEHLRDRQRGLLVKLARSGKLWERRVAMVSTFQFIKIGEVSTALEVAEILLHDPHDLVQKAVGWMLREVGKRGSERVMVDFLEKHYKAMPRTTLRYAIERLSPEQKAHFMQK